MRHPKQSVTADSNISEILDELADSSDEDRGNWIVKGLDLARELRQTRQFEQLALFCDALRRYESGASPLYQAQAFIELGMSRAALDLLKVYLDRDDLEAGSSLWVEATGLVGRANKEIFLQAPEQNTAAAAMEHAMEAYGQAFNTARADQDKTWPGINLVALAKLSKTAGLGLGADDSTEELARKIETLLHTQAHERRDKWWLATLAEVLIARDDWENAVKIVKDFLDKRDISPFEIGSFLRQLVEVWKLDTPQAPPEARKIVEVLRAQLLRLGQVPVRVPAASAGFTLSRETQQTDTAEKVLGNEGPQTIHWWRMGLERARSVASIWTNLTNDGQWRRYGTGFLVPVINTDGSSSPSRFVLTNAHVASPKPLFSSSIQSANRLAVCFEAVDETTRIPVRGFVWTSRPHDATLLELDPTTELPPDLELSRALPPADSQTKLYIIGHPKGGEMAFSFQDNTLLDHEGPPQGKPGDPPAVKLQYRTPTEPGSSGSPVFLETCWQTVALHHAGHESMPQLNQNPGNHPANEGISLASISDCLKKEIGISLQFID